MLSAAEVQSVNPYMINLCLYVCDWRDVVGGTLVDLCAREVGCAQRGSLCRLLHIRTVPLQGELLISVGCIPRRGTVRASVLFVSCE